MMLACLLPGLREVRTPITIGYLWLVVIWIWFESYLPVKRPSGDGMVASLFDLSYLVGPAATVAVVSFIAYLVGILLRLPIRVVDVAADLVYLFFKKASQTDEEFYRLIKETAESIRRRIDTDNARSLALRTELDRTAQGGIEELRPRLLVANQGLYGEYDRLEAEADFRLNLCPGLAALGFTASSQVADFWALATIGIVLILAYKGIVSYLQAVSVIQRAVLAGVIKHPVQALHERMVSGA
jgi:hypothetical protein